MHINKRARLAMMLAASAALCSTPLLAAEVVSSGTQATFAGPSLSYPQIGSLTGGYAYPVTVCLEDLSWCKVVGDGGTLGWALGSYIVGSPAKVEARQWNLTAKDFWNPRE